MASGTTTLWRQGLLSGSYNMSSNTLYCALMNSTYTFNAAQTTWSSISSTEISVATGYTAGGAALTSLVVSSVGGVPYFSATNQAWASFTGSPYHAVIYDTSVSSNIVCAIDFGGIQTVSAGTLTLSWNASGIVTLS